MLAPARPVTTNSKRMRLFIAGAIVFLSALITFLLAMQFGQGASVTIENSVSTTTGSIGSPSPKIVFTSDTVGYVFYVDSDNSCNYKKTTDGGATWATEVNNFDSVNTTDCLAVAIWYDRWTPGDTTGNYIHVATADVGFDDIYYTRLDTSNDTKSTSVVTDTQASSLAGGNQNLSITKSTGGTLYTGVVEATDTFFLSCSAGCTVAESWTETAAHGVTGADVDLSFLMPLADNDILALWYDQSASTIYWREYDDSSGWLGSWTSVAATIQLNTAYDGQIALAQDLDTYLIYLVHADDTNAFSPNTNDILAKTFDGTTWTAKTNIITNSAYGISGVSIALDQNSKDVVVGITAQTLGLQTQSGVPFAYLSRDGMTTWESKSGGLYEFMENLYAVHIVASTLERIFLFWGDPTLQDLVGVNLWNAGAGPYVYVGSQGTQTTSFQSGTTNQYLGGAFTLVRDSGTADVTSITITETGTIDAGSYVANLDLYYETASTCTYNGDETYFGTDAAFSGGDVAVVEGTLTVGTSNICIYPVFDIVSGGLGTLSFEITNPEIDIAITAGAPPQLYRVPIAGLSTVRSATTPEQVTLDSSIVTVVGRGNTATSNTVFISDTVGYAFYIDSDNSCNYKKTIDGGATWPTEVNNFDSVNTADCMNIAVWYDRWTPGDTTGNYIHVATLDNGADDVYYTRLDTSNDTKTASVVTLTQAAVVGGTTEVISITKTTTGVLYTGLVDATDSFFLRCSTGCTVAESWTEMATSGVAVGDDSFAMFPDGEDVVVIWHDPSIDYFYSREWDDSASGWAGAGWTTVVAAVAQENTTTTIGWSATMGGGSIYLAYIQHEGGVNISQAGGFGDIVVYSYDGSTWTLKTDVLTNEQRAVWRVSLAYDSANDVLYALYATIDQSDFNTQTINYKTSTDGGATWSSASARVVNTNTDLYVIPFHANMTSDERIYLIWKDEDADDLFGATVVDITSGSLGVDIVDAGGATVGSPSMAMTDAVFSFAYQVITGSFGTSSERIRVTNGTGAAAWTLSIAAQDGATAFWNGLIDYDFNDPTANAGDGGDADSIGGQMTVDASGATVTPEGGCDNTGVTLGTSSAFSQGVTDSITIASTDGSADTNCYWDITDIDISQSIPPEQGSGSYQIDMTLSIIAS